MTLIGDTMMCEQAGPKQLVRDAALAEEAGRDHYFPWPRATRRTRGACSAGRPGEPAAFR